MVQLVAPAGNLEKLKTAIFYGANAVYLSGKKFGLRYGADNFSVHQLALASELCQKNKVKIYLTLNIFPLPQDLEELPAFLKKIANIHFDAFICSDLGLINIVQQYSSVPIHLSTQASTMNVWQALLLKKLNIKRIVVARELSISEAEFIKQKTGLEIEIFVHGAMCSAISGHCTLSNYQNGRDSNRGGCIQNCRFDYRLHNKTYSLENFNIGSKDLNGFRAIKNLLNSNIDALKIEGRMKSAVYLATVVRAYRHLLDNSSNDGQNIKFWQEELSAIRNRQYWDGFLLPNNQQNSIQQSGHSSQSFAGKVLEYDKKNSKILFLPANQLKKGDQLNFLLPNGQNYLLTINDMQKINGENCLVANSSHTIWLKTIYPLPALTIARFLIEPKTIANQPETAKLAII